ncbi:GPI inositol-deacylase-like protein [Aphelenchoides avenae]|nr:GPI inositol-deacylase-like protein [Aphelenchus avenae]
MRGGRVNAAKLLAFAAVGFCVFLTWRHLKRETKNDCAMTFMWRMMNYMDVGFRHGERYTLLLYGEGAYAYNFIHTQKVNGIPVIFIPGNAGSGRQVRSLGSVLQNKTELLNTPFHFDTFAVDFNEELSGFSSEYLDLQKDYLSHAIDYIWEMYETSPQGIVLVGHSMGGIVARSLLVDPKFNASRISLVLTFATPHSEPPYPLDKRIIELWSGLSASLPRAKDGPFSPQVVSVSGGLKDELIDEAWTAEPSVFHVSTTEIDTVWLETDHQCIR